MTYKTVGTDAITPLGIFTSYNFALESIQIPLLEKLEQLENRLQPTQETLVGYIISCITEAISLERINLLRQNCFDYRNKYPNATSWDVVFEITDNVLQTYRFEVIEFESNESCVNPRPFR